MNQEQVCRICLDQTVMLVNIFKEPDHQQLPNLMDMLNEFCDTRPDDGLPPHICLGCASEAGIAYRFKRRCEDSQRHFYQLMLMEGIKKEPTEPQELELELKSDIDLGCVKVEQEQPHTFIISEADPESGVDSEQWLEPSQLDTSEELSPIKARLAHRAAYMKQYRAQHYHQEQHKKTRATLSTEQLQNQRAKDAERSRAYRARQRNQADYKARRQAKTVQKARVQVAPIQEYSEQCCNTDLYSSQDPLIRDQETEPQQWLDLSECEYSAGHLADRAEPMEQTQAHYQLQVQMSKEAKTIEKDAVLLLKLKRAKAAARAKAYRERKKLRKTAVNFLEQSKNET